jgi:predicted  nucleic acid-binding Zn-ribbon protein
MKHRCVKCKLIMKTENVVTLQGKPYCSNCATEYAKKKMTTKIIKDTYGQIDSTEM